MEQRTQEEAHWKKKLAGEQKEHAEATKTYEQELAEVRQTEMELERAAATLRRFRRPPHVDNGGGVYDVPDRKSSALTPRVSAVAALLSAAMAVLVF